VFNSLWQLDALIKKKAAASETPVPAPEAPKA